MQVGDLVRYKQGSLDMVGIITGQRCHGDYWVQFVDGTKSLCRHRCLEVINASR